MVDPSRPDNSHQQIADIVGCSRAHVFKAEKLVTTEKGREILKKCQSEQTNKYTPPISRAFNELSKWERNEAAQRAASIELPPAPEGSLLDDVHCLDVLDGLRRLKEGSVRVNLIITSVPYPIVAVEYPNYKYDGDYPKWPGVAALGGGSMGNLIRT